MPLVRIAVRQGKTAAYRRAVADAIHEGMVEAIKVPKEDRFQIVTEHDADGLIVDRTFLGVDRSDDAVIVQISLRRGRPVELKQALCKRIVEKLADGPGVRPEDVLIVLSENDLADWSFGNGEAQYVLNPPQPIPAAA